MLRLMIGLIIIGLLLPTGPGYAQEESIVSQPEAQVTFGEEIYFRWSLISEQPPNQAYVFIQEKNSPNTITEQASIHQQNDGEYLIEYTLPIQEQPLRAFSRIEYSFEVTLNNGEVMRSNLQELEYNDDRFDWRHLDETPFRVYWVEGEIPFAQSILDIAQLGLKRIQSLTSNPSPDQVQIYVYPTAAELQETLLISGKNWIAGHAHPDLGVILVTLPVGAEQNFLIEQRIPHELTHVVMYKLLGDRYERLPVWLSEGLASFAELYPNPDYEKLLDDAYQKDRLLPMTFLCQKFPTDASNVLLAYAQSASLTQYIYQNYGANGLKNLVNEYADGVDCERGAQIALGVRLSNLERQWRHTRFGEDAVRIAWQNILPWLIVLLAVLLPPLILIIVWPRRKPVSTGIRGK